MGGEAASAMNAAIVLQGEVPEGELPRRQRPENIEIAHHPGQGGIRHIRRENSASGGGAAGVAPLSQLTTASFPTQSHLLFAQNFQVSGQRLSISSKAGGPASKSN